MRLIGLMLVVGLLSGCVACKGTLCGSNLHNASSLVEFLYPNDERLPPQNTIPELKIPLRVGLAFLPSTGPEVAMQLSAADQEQLLERIRQHFLTRQFVADIVIIPDYYLRARRGYAGLAGVQRLYNVDVMALVSYDQVTHLDDNEWSIGYLTIVGAYVLKGNRHDISTLVDLAVVDPATHSLLLRAGGVDSRAGTATLLNTDRLTREAGVAGFSAATDQLIEHFDAALVRFEGDVKAGRAAVKVVHKNAVAGSWNSGIGSSGGGAVGWPEVLALLLVLALRYASGRLHIAWDRRPSAHS
jgi:rhombotail lipoprotein